MYVHPLHSKSMWPGLCITWPAWPHSLFFMPLDIFIIFYAQIKQCISHGLLAWPCIKCVLEGNIKIGIKICIISQFQWYCCYCHIPCWQWQWLELPHLKTEAVTVEKTKWSLVSCPFVADSDNIMDRCGGFFSSGCICVINDCFKQACVYKWHV